MTNDIGPVGTAAHIHTMTAFPGQVVMESDFRDGKCWPIDRPGLGIALDTAQLNPVVEYTEAIRGNTYRRRDGSPSHW